MARRLFRAARQVPAPLGANNTRGADDDWSQSRPEDVVACYRLLLGRKPDDRELRGYLHNIEARPIPISELASYFLTSPEFRSRLQQLVDWSARIPIPVEVDGGIRLLVDPEDPSVGTEIRTSGFYEPHVTKALLPRLRPGSVFVDVGASIGYYSVLAGRRVGSEGKVIACEAGTQNHALFLLNMHSNNVMNFRLAKVAVGREPGLALYSAEGANGSIEAYGGDATQLATKDLVEVQTLDTLLADESGIGAIKIDVEGAEGLVLLGAERTLEREHAALFFEFNGPMIRYTSKMEPIDLLTFLERLGYSFSVINKDSTVEARSAREIERLDETSEVNHLDLMAVAP